MTRPVLLNPLAQAELDKAVDWYEERVVGLGVAFTAAVRSVLVDIGKWPEAQPKIQGDVRYALLEKYPYAVFYRSSPTQVRVMAILHTSRDPSEWQKRK